MSDGEDARDHPRLGWKDYLALFVAFIQTVALPLVILVAILIAVVLVSAALR